MTSGRNARLGWLARLGICFVAAVLFWAVPASADTCYYVVLDIVTIEYYDGSGTLIGSDTRYYFGWLCFGDGGGSYEIPTGGGGEPDGPKDPPTGGGCTVDLCQGNCDISYYHTIQGEVVDSPWGGPTWYKCGVVCMNLAAADRDACYAFCLEDCAS